MRRAERRARDGELFSRGARPGADLDDACSLGAIVRELHTAS